MQAGSEVSRVRWARPGAAAYVAFVSLLMAANLFNLGRRPSLDDGAWLGVAGLIVVWALELGGLRWPRTVLSLVTAAIVPYLAYTFDTEFTRLNRRSPKRSASAAKAWPMCGGPLASSRTRMRPAPRLDQSWRRSRQRLTCRRWSTNTRGRECAWN